MADPDPVTRQLLAAVVSTNADTWDITEASPYAEPVSYVERQTAVPGLPPHGGFWDIVVCESVRWPDLAPGDTTLLARLQLHDNPAADPCPEHNLTAEVRPATPAGTNLSGVPAGHTVLVAAVDELAAWVPPGHTVWLTADEQRFPLSGATVTSLAFAEDYITGWEQDTAGVEPGVLVPAVDKLAAWSDLEPGADELVLVEYGAHVSLADYYTTTRTVVFAELVADDV